MSKKKLVIVESPAKAKTIEKILGSGYEVTASYGHVRDLPKTTLGVKLEENYKPSYSVMKDKKEVVEKLKAMAKAATTVYLASDPDREGESIAWHIAKVLKLKEDVANRIEFNEITKSAVKDSIKHARKIDMNMVDAQQARRVLDRIVGYKISPLLWQMVKEGTSAGRVQSVALKLVCDLENEIRAFIPEKYFTVNGEFKNINTLPLYKIDDKRVEMLKDEEVVEKLKKYKKGADFIVTSANVSKKSKAPPLPLKTSTLQQLASSYLGFTAMKTMRVAQGLYEGILVNGEQKGLITYMRTDSVRISEEAKDMAKKFITEVYGDNYVGAQKESKSKQKIQDAHEAIRPSDVYLTPDSIGKQLDSDQLKLYKLIWDRFIISQMSKMEYEQFEIILSRDEFSFRGTTNKIIFDGYYKIFKDEEDLPLGDFPKIEIGDIKKLEKLNIKEEYTKAPARLTESSLVKRLEQEGIGRPSTYAAIVDTLKSKEYVKLEGKSFAPTELGFALMEELQANFPGILNIKFTAEMENKLDNISTGEYKWTDVLDEFYKEFKVSLDNYESKVNSRRIISDVTCHCSTDYMVMKVGPYGKYLECENENCRANLSLKGIDVPIDEIKNERIFVKEKLYTRDNGYLSDFLTEEGVPCRLKNGRFGPYLESDKFSHDNFRMSLPSDLKKLYLSDKLEYEFEEEIVKGEKLSIRKYLVAEAIKKIKDEENEILSKAGVCEKCGRPFKVNRGRWGKFLSCTGYPECSNIKKLDEFGNIIPESETKEKMKAPSKKTATKKVATKKAASKTTTKKEKKE